MGIESDQLVYAYLSRVGDLAQRRQLPSGDRMRLVAGLRDEIDRRRARFEPETEASVRQILNRLGTPEQVLDEHQALAARPPAADPAPPLTPAVPQQRTAANPPHMAGLDELGPSDPGPEPDWWRLPQGSRGGGPLAEPEVEGFAGGIEYPAFRPPQADEDDPAEPDAPADARKAATAGKAQGAEGDDDAAAGGTGSRARAVVRALRERRRRRKAAAPPPPEAPAARPQRHGALLLAAAVLVAGTVTGYWLLLAAGWLVAYASKVLGPAEKKWVVFGLPGTVCAAAVVWLWGRADGRWGDPLLDGQLAPAFESLWPWTVRAAAITSALYLTWRSRRT
ncbi:HAAS signaling domain-containing protein [Streptomyces antimicrobicus]|uniref:Integral membrane protein n=1 Tax=Streptomyces antimicrobicus TaxID=2883108 RepID=A0ABS8B2J1_9ACTN|nr:hypothetical protein [Streptomyces antimicrobicus]MCB5178834.1 hypothetical protein [Streptomyces antimicrobicus]